MNRDDASALAFFAMLVLVTVAGIAATAWQDVERAKLEAARPCECGEGRK